MRALLALPLALLAFSGCISDNDPGTSAPAPTMDADAAAPAAPADARVVEAYDLALGLAETTWTFEVAREGVADLFVKAIGRFADQVVYDPDLCVRWQVVTPNGHSSGSRGTCSNGGVALTVNPPALGHQMVLDWEEPPAGQYTISITARPQPNILNVHFVVDNP